MWAIRRKEQCEEKMVGDAGIEPATPSMSTKCSPAELIAHVCLIKQRVLSFTGAVGKRHYRTATPWEARRLSSGLAVSLHRAGLAEGFREGNLPKDNKSFSTSRILAMGL